MVQSDGAIGQMMEKVEVGDQKPSLTEEEIIRNCPWATTGKTPDRERNIITSLNLDSQVQEQHNIKLQKKYREIEAKEVRFEKINARMLNISLLLTEPVRVFARNQCRLLRAKGIKVGLVRPITLYPFPKDFLFNLAGKLKGILSVEMSAGQMVEDIKLAVEGKVPVFHFGRMGGIVPSPTEVADFLEHQFIKG